ncbi:hypothetical protein [Aeoliella sp.]|uniref:hypothetical protein n=1 Tax=Aeoliella sp. TaxID=2795800 RepID=UPI003CCC047C
MRHYPLLLVLAVVAAVGCATKEDKASYADLVMIYNAEAEALDRLERKRADRIAEYEATLRPSGDAAIEALGGMLESMKDTPPPDLNAADPNELLDNAIANAENLDAQAGDLLEAAAAAAGKPPSREAIVGLYSEEFKAELAALDAEIEEQRARVDKAKANRDAAEPK